MWLVATILDHIRLCQFKVTRRPVNLQDCTFIRLPDNLGTWVIKTGPFPLKDLSPAKEDI